MPRALPAPELLSKRNLFNRYETISFIFVWASINGMTDMNHFTLIWNTLLREKYIHYSCSIFIFTSKYNQKSIKFWIWFKNKLSILIVLISEIMKADSFQHDCKFPNKIECCVLYSYHIFSIHFSRIFCNYETILLIIIYLLYL